MFYFSPIFFGITKVFFDFSVQMSDSDLSPPPPPNISGNQRGSDGDWTCPDCGNVNFARRNACNR